MMSRLFSTLTKQVNDNQFTHLYILEKFYTDCKILKGLYFCCVGFEKKNATIFAIFHIRCVFSSTSYFSFEKDPGIVKIVSLILKSLFYQKLVKIV